MNGRPRLLAALLALFLVLALTAPTPAQLVTVDKEYHVVEIDSTHRQIKVADIDGDAEKVSATVLVTSDTKLFVLGKELPNFTWRLLRKGMRITVNGGMTWDMKVKAKQIHLL